MAWSYIPVKGSTYPSPTKQSWRRLSRFGQEPLLPAVDQNHSCDFAETKVINGRLLISLGTELDEYRST